MPRLLASSQQFDDPHNLKSDGQWQLFGGFDVKITSVSQYHLVMLPVSWTDHTPFIIESHAF